MWQHVIGFVSGLLVVVSNFPLCWGIQTGKRELRSGQWTVWALIAFTMAFTYCNAGTGANAWPAVFGFANVVTACGCVFRTIKRKYGSLDSVNLHGMVVLFCAFGSVLAIVVGFVPHGVRLLLYCAMFADALIAIRVIRGFVSKPDTAGPFAYVFFGCGHGLSMFAIVNHTVANYALPVYMVAVSLCAAVPLTIYRLKKGVPFRTWQEWI